MPADYDIVFHDQSDLDPYNCNVDVEVHFRDGRRYSCTVFTLKNIERLFVKFNESGEYLNGKYFYCPDMIVVCIFDKSVIKSIIDDIIKSNNVDIALKFLED
jgi:hypothetical protein